MNNPPLIWSSLIRSSLIRVGLAALSLGGMFCSLSSPCAAQTPVPPGGGTPESAGQNLSVGQTATLTVRSTLVQVPALVKTKKGELVYSLKASDFEVTDDGVPQTLRLDDDTDHQPLALAVVVETGGAGITRMEDYANLEPILEALVGGVEHHIALIGFDSTPHLIVRFTPREEVVAHELSVLDQGDEGAAILDGVAFAVEQLRREPQGFRRAILLLSETIDGGSHTSLNEALRLISDTNTTMYSFGFASTKVQLGKEARKFGYVGQPPLPPGPARGCFSRDRSDPNQDPDNEGHYGKQVLDCISQLAPPLRLATLGFLGARNSLRRNTAESIAQLTGGEFFHFHDVKSLQRGFLAASNDVPNRYVLSFRPSAPHAGLHTLQVRLKDRPELQVAARTAYWAEDEAEGSSPSP